MENQEKKTYNTLNYSKLSQNLKSNIARRKAAKNDHEQQALEPKEQDNTQYEDKTCKSDQQ